MKRFFAFVLIICVCFAICVLADEIKPITVTLNGDAVDCASYGQEPIIVEGRTLVPLRAIFEALGASVEWNQETKTVLSVLDKTEISLTIGDDKLIKNGGEILLDVPAQIINGRTLVPVRAVSESFGVLVEWESETRTVILVKDGYVRGTVRDNVYTSRWLNVRFTRPDGFEFAQQKHLKELMGLAGDVSLENFDIASALSMYEFVLFNQEGEGISLTAEKTDTHKSETEYAKKVFDAYMSMGVDFDVADFSLTRIAGLDFKTYETKIVLNEKNVNIIISVAKKNEYFVTLACLIYDGDKFDDIVSHFEMISEIEQNTQTKMFTFDEMLSKIDEKLTKSELDSEILARFGDLGATASSVKYAVALAYFSNLEGKEFEIAVKEYVKNLLAVEFAIRENNIMYSEEELENLLVAGSYLKAYFGTDSDALYFNTGFSSAYDYCRQMLILNSVRKIVQSQKTNERFMKKVYDRTVIAFTRDEYVRAKHILVKTDNGNKNEKLKQAKEILSLVNAHPEKFDLYMRAFGEDLGMESYTGGYVFSKGEMAEPFEKAVYNMAPENISGIVETEYGYHIIKKLDIIAEDFDTTSGYDSDLFYDVVKSVLVENYIDDSDDHLVVYSNDFREKSEQFALDLSEISKIHN